MITIMKEILWNTELYLEPAKHLFLFSLIHVAIYPLIGLQFINILILFKQWFHSITEMKLFSFVYQQPWKTNDTAMTRMNCKERKHDVSDKRLKLTHEMVQSIVNIVTSYCNLRFFIIHALHRSIKLYVLHTINEKPMKCILSRSRYSFTIQNYFPASFYIYFYI